MTVPTDRTASMKTQFAWFLQPQDFLRRETGEESSLLPARRSPDHVAAAKQTKAASFDLSGLASAFALLAGISRPAVVRADITVAGDYEPAAGTSWTKGGNPLALGRIGNTGTGTLSITGGATLVFSAGYLGVEAGSIGSATVTDGAWIIPNYFLFVGDAGTGNLLINGGSVTVGNATIIGSRSGSQGSITITGGSFTSGDLCVGDAGVASLLVRGGIVSSCTAVVGNTGRGSVLVAGKGSCWSLAGSLTIGYDGSGSMLILADSALVKVGDASGGTIQFSTGIGSDNYLQLNGGYLALYGDQTSYITSLITAGNIQLRDGDAWVTSADTADFKVAYFASNEEAEAFSGYSGLGGYTILSEVGVGRRTPDQSKWLRLFRGIRMLYGNLPGRRALS